MNICYEYGSSVLFPSSSSGRCLSHRHANRSGIYVGCTPMHCAEEEKAQSQTRNKKSIQVGREGQTHLYKQCPRVIRRCCVCVCVRYLIGSLFELASFSFSDPTDHVVCLCEYPKCTVDRTQDCRTHTIDQLQTGDEH